jgi:hypothetical protein
MEHAAAQAAGWILTKTHAVVFLVIWGVVVLVYGLWRSLGEAKQDTIRPSGPTE